MTKPTQAPWISSGCHVQALYTPNDGGKPFYKTIARLDQPLTDGDETNANSKLIAAAPDLLQSVKELIAELEGWGIGEEQLKKARENVRKAEGK